MMADINTNFVANNGLVVVKTRQEAIAENIWVIGVSKTHPGLKYYFNTITGVSLWNISKEDMERAKRSTNANGSQPQYINCPEPNEPPPIKLASSKLSPSSYYKHVCQYSKTYNEQLVQKTTARKSSGYSCDVSCASVNTTPNIITVNFQPYQYPTCLAPLDNANSTMPQSEQQSTLAASNTGTFERNNCNTILNHYQNQKVKEKNCKKSKRIQNTPIADILVQDSNNEQTHNDRIPDSEFFDDPNHFDILDLAPLKKFAKTGVVQDKWYIIADTNVYLHHINFIKTIINSDNQCCLMVPQIVKIELDSATKTQLKHEAYYANCYMYKMLHHGFAIIDDGSAEQLGNKNKEKHILQCCTKLMEQNYYVVVISNDLNFQKYRSNTFIPVFTVADLREYLCKTNQSITKKTFSESTCNIVQMGKQVNVPVLNNQHMLNYNMPHIQISTMTESDIVENSNRTSSVLNNTGTQVNMHGVPKTTADAEVQTNFPVTQIQEVENVYKHKHMLKNNMPHIHNSTMTESNIPENSNRTSSVLNDTGTQVNMHSVPKITVDAEVHTNFPLTQIQEVENVYKHKHMLKNNMPHIQISTMTESDIVENSNRTSSVLNNTGTQVNMHGVPKTTADAEVQTNFPVTQIQEVENVYKNTVLENQKDNINKSEYIQQNSSPSCQPSPHRTVLTSGIKLRRRKICEQTKVHYTKSNIITLASLNNNLPRNKNIKDQSKNISITKKKTKLHDASKSNSLAQPNKSNSVTAKNHNDCKNKNTNETLKLNQDTVVNAQKKIIENSNVMFEITTETMAQNLRIKSDEWVSRFVQIMEEVLTQVLRKKSSLYPRVLPPWNMNEAALCIKETFKNDGDITDASNKFLKVLHLISDEKGNFNANISPTHYMEMYSFGVYLVDALQSMFSTCEDLQTAAESLSKLLSDIQDAEMDISNHEGFQNLSQDKHSDINTGSDDDKVEVLMIIETDSLSNENLFKDSNDVFEMSHNNTSNDCIPDDQLNFKHHNQIIAVNEGNNTSEIGKAVIGTEMETNSNKTPPMSLSSYNLRSRQKRVLLENQEQPTSLRACPVNKNCISKKTFLSKISLQKNVVKKNMHTSDDGVAKNITSDLSKYKSNLEIDEVCTEGLNRHATDSPHKADQLSNRPKIVRNFVMCSEFEERLARKFVHDEIEEFDFDDNLTATDYMDADDNLVEQRRLHIDEFPEYHNNRDVIQTTESIEYVNINFKYFIGIIAKEIKQLSSTVYSFCEDSYKSLKSLSSSDDKSGILEKAEQMHLYINKLCVALTNILYRDKSGSNNIKEMYRNTEFDGLHVDEEQMKAYGAFIARCLEQAQDLGNTVKDVVSAVCEH